MSASLVGSEMCIRDSHTGADEQVIISMTGTRPWGNPRGVSGGPDKATRCLLYTSDAADDM
eukprot:10477608-Alexandrium_andersonii.AAC.1